MKRPLHKNILSPSSLDSFPTSSPLTRDVRLKTILGRIVIILITLLFTWQTAQTFLNRQTQRNLDINNLCSSRNTQFEGVDLTHIKDRLCDLDEEPYQFNKFIWLVTDGFPIKFASFVEEVLNPHLITYLVDIPGPKYSHAIYTSFLTGLLPMNLPGEPIKGDSLLKSLVRSGFKLQYVGPEWSFLAMSGKENYNSLFTKIELEFESLLSNYEHAYPFFFEDEEAISRLRRTLKDIKKKNISLITHSGVIDHRQHGDFRTGNFFYTSRIGRRCGNDFRILKEWVDENPEYLLIASSDHGVDEMTASGYRMHGDSARGNEGYFMFYNPKIKTKPEKMRIDIVDVCPTLAKYLQGVDIPANAIGVPRNHFESTNSSTSDIEIRVLQQSLLQKLIPWRVRGLRQKYSMEEINKLLLLPETDNLTPTEEKIRSAVAELETVLHYFKGELYKSSIYVSAVTLILWVLVGIGIALVILKSYNQQLLSLIFQRRKVWNSLKELLVLFFVYGGFYLPALASWWIWKRVHNMGLPYKIWSSLIALVLLYYLFDRLIRYRSSSTSQSSSTSKEWGHLKSAMRLIVMNEVVQVLVHTLSELNSRVDMKFGEMFYGPVFSGLVYLGLIATTIGFLKYRMAGSRDSNFYSFSGRIVIWGAIVLNLILFEKFDSWGSKILGFSTCALVVYGGGVLLMLVGIFNIKLPFYGKNSIIDVLFPLNVIIFMLWVEPTSYRGYLLIFNFQILCFVWPAVESVFQLGKLKNDEDDILSSVRLETLRQAAMAYLISCGFFSFSGVSLDLPNIDVHPVAGAIGLIGFDVYPNFSAFLMAFHKYCTFVVILVYVSFAWFKIESETESYPEEEDLPKRDNVFSSLSIFSKKKKNPLGRSLDIANIMLILMFTCSVLGFNFLIRFFTLIHGFQESASTVGLTGFILVVYNVMCLTQDLFYGEASHKQ